MRTIKEIFETIEGNKDMRLIAVFADPTKDNSDAMHELRNELPADWKATDNWVGTFVKEVYTHTQVVEDVEVVWVERKIYHA